MEDLRGDREMVNSKSEDDDDEKEWDGDDGSVWDFWVLIFSVLLPMSLCSVLCCALLLLHYFSLSLSVYITVSLRDEEEMGFCSFYYFECKLQRGLERRLFIYY